MRRPIIFLAAILATAAVAAPALGSGGNYVLSGGTAAQRGQIRNALDASAFDWSLISEQITIHITSGDANAEATPGSIWVPGQLLDAGMFSWATVQHEYAHQVDYFLFDDTAKADLLGLLGGRNWCYSRLGLPHASYGCERFASTLTWAYWPVKANALRPESRKDESAAMAPAAFRTLMQQLIGAPDTVGSRRTAAVKVIPLKP